MIEIDISSPEAIYEQIISQLGLALISGELIAGDKLPPIRQLASDLEVNPNTVAKAYQILEENKIIKGHGRSGSIIQVDAGALFKDWLVMNTKEQLKAAWGKTLALSPDKKLAAQIWAESLKELRNEK